MTALKIRENVCLQEYNTMAVPASARYFVSIDNLEQLQAASDFAQQHKLSIFILGEGSNTLFTQDIDGLLIHNQLKGIDVLDQDSDSVVVKVAAGENWHQWVKFSVEQGWYGLENLALIPGLVGAAPIQNIGAYGVEVKQFIQSVEFIELNRLQPQTYTAEQYTAGQCQFSYRDSVFKHELADKILISAVIFKLHKKTSLMLDYPALANCFNDLLDKTQITSEQVFEAVCQLRESKLPDPVNIPNTGSFFKNPVISQEQHKVLKQRYPDMVSFETVNGQGEIEYKLAAAWLIERAGFKQKELEHVTVHQQQSLVIINPAKQTGDKVLAYAQSIQQSIASLFDIQLSIEPRVY